MDTRTGLPQRRYPEKCNACILRGILVFSEVTAEDIATFHTSIDDVRIKAKETVFFAKAPASWVFCIRAGFIKLVTFSSVGGQRIVRIVKPGGVVGTEALFSSSYDHTAIAMQNVVACRIPLGFFRGMVDGNATLQKRLLEYSHHELLEAETWLAELAGGNAQVHERIARLLLRLRDGRTDRIHHFSLEDIGAMLGITVETACRNLTELTRTGVLTKCDSSTGSRHYRADIAGLEQIAEGGDTAKAAAKPHRSSGSDK